MCESEEREKDKDVRVGARECGSGERVEREGKRERERVEVGRVLGVTRGSENVRENGERKRWYRVRVGEWCDSGKRKGVRVGIEL